MQCTVCGGDFRPSGRGAPQRYCSRSCRNRAYYLRSKDGLTAPRAKGKTSEKKAPGKNAAAGKADGTVTVPARPSGPPRERKKAPAPEPDAIISRSQFERMMDEGVPDTLRAVRDRLRKALDDLDTPASALPAIGRSLIDISERLEGLEVHDALDGLLDGEDVDDGVTAAIV